MCLLNPLQSTATSSSDLDDQLLRTFNLIRGKLLGKLQAMLGNEDDARDALQSAFLNCWRGRAALANVTNVQAWVWRVGLNAGRDLRDLVWRRRARPIDCVEAVATCPRQSPFAAAAEQEQREQVESALLRLRPAEREVFLLRQREALTYQQIASRRDIPPGTAKTLMRKAMRKLQFLLKSA